MGALTINNPQARVFFSSYLDKSITQDTFFFKNGLIAKEDTPEAQGAVIIERTRDFVQGKGYKVTFDLDGPTYGYPTAGDNNIASSERMLSLYWDGLQVNQDRFAYINNGQFSEGLVPHSFRDRVRERATQFWNQYYDERFIAKMSGALGSGTWLTINSSMPTASARDIDGSVASDGNDLRAPTSGRIVYGNGAANQAAMTTADGPSLNVIDRAVRKAMQPSSNTTLNRLVKPLMIKGQSAFIFLADYSVLEALWQNVSGRFYDIGRAMAQGGMKDSPLLQASNYVYASPLGVKVFFMAHPNMVRFSASATGSVKVVRCLLLGQGACTMAKARNAANLPQYSWHEETKNGGNQLAVYTGTTVGIQKAGYSTTETGSTREDWGVIAVDVYADY